jgi:hypothetical protein
LRESSYIYEMSNNLAAKDELATVESSLELTWRKGLVSYVVDRSKINEKYLILELSDTEGVEIGMQDTMCK